MVSQQQAMCWQNSEQIEDWVPGCGDGRLEQYIASAELNGGCVDDLTIYLFAQPKRPQLHVGGPLAPHCIYVIDRQPSGRTYRCRCLFHGSKSGKPDAAIVEGIAACRRRGRWHRYTRFAMAISLCLIMAGSILRHHRRKRKVLLVVPTTGKEGLPRMGLRGVSLRPSQVG